MTTLPPCAVCGSRRSIRYRRADAVYCEDATGCARRRHPRPRWTYIGPSGARANADHRITRNGASQVVPRCQSCGGLIGPAA